MRNVVVVPLLLSCLVFVLAGAKLAPAGVAQAAASSTLDRPSDPVVLTGADLPWLAGIDPDDLVAFRYDGGWQQIPVQVDEKAVVDFGVIYGGDPAGYQVLTYTDTSTFTGPDPDSSFDVGDELVLMAKHAGGKAAGMASLPDGVPVTGSGVELMIVDPLGPDTAYAYLFENSTHLFCS